MSVLLLIKHFLNVLRVNALHFPELTSMLELRNYLERNSDLRVFGVGDRVMNRDKEYCLKICHCIQSS